MSARRLIINVDGADCQTCNSCQAIKPLEEFGVQGNVISGRSGRCSSCIREINRQKFGWSPKKPPEPVVKIDGIDHKKCLTCLITKPLADFVVSKSADGRSGNCRVCTNKRRQNKKEAGLLSDIPFQPRACTKCNIVKDRNDFSPSEFCRDGYTATCILCRRLWGMYRLTSVEYQVLLDQSLGLCAICTNPMETANIDHDHACCPGQRSCGSCIRGLLCGSCNRGIGLLKDSPKVLIAAAEYLEKYHGSIT